jgi:hypothetical protein
MIKLNGEDAQQAWADYKEYLIGMGGNLNPEHPGAKAWLNEVERAFKFAFAAGKSATQVVEPQLSPVIKVHVGAKQPTGITRTHNPDREIKRRSDKQMDQDARLVASIMQRNGGAMKLEDILKAVNAAGGDWYDKSASGHMRKVMERIPAIKKVGYGLYKYEQ